MNTSNAPALTLTPYGGQVKQVLFQLIETKQPVKVATANNARAIVTEARLHSVKVSRRKLACGSYNVFLP